MRLRNSRNNNSVKTREEVRMVEYCDDREDARRDEDYRDSEWLIGLPSGDDLTPLCQSLVPSILGLAFSIVPERFRTVQDVNRASQNTIYSLRCNASSLVTAAVVVEEIDRFGSSSSPGSDPKKQRKWDGGEAMDSIAEEGGDSGTEDPYGKTLKRPRLVWTPQLHKRFVDVVAHLGIKNAVPKAIMQLMKVEGLTRENVASHLQKYRGHLKRVQGLSMEGSSSSDHLISSTLVPSQRFQKAGGANGESGKLGIPIPVSVYGNMQEYSHGRDHNPQYHHHGNEFKRI